MVFSYDVSWSIKWAFSSVKSLSSPNSLPKHLKEDPSWDYFIIDRKVRAVLLVTAFLLSHTKGDAFVDPYGHTCPFAPGYIEIDQRLSVFYVICYNSCIVSELKPGPRVRVDIRAPHVAEMFILILRQGPHEWVEAYVEKEGRARVTLKDSSFQWDEFRVSFSHRNRYNCAQVYVPY